MNNSEILAHTSCKAFTLIELMVAMTIVVMITLMTYIPYAHHQKKVLLQQASREIAQSFSEVRNFALNGLNTGSGNVNVGLYIPQNATYLAYYTATGVLDLTSVSTETPYKVKQLPQGVQVDSISGNNNEYLFLFTAISGDMLSFPSITGNEFEIQTSYKGASTSVLQKTIRYYIQSHISDY